jgi:pyruvate kinase
MAKILKSKPLDLPKTCIIATVGGSDIYSKRYLGELVQEGATVIRINLAHIEHPSNLQSEGYQHVKRIVDDVRDISNEMQRPIGMLLDICGPKIRICDLPQPIPIQTGDEITFTTDSGCFSKERCSVTYHGFVSDIQKNHKIFLDDGKIRLKVIDKKVEQHNLICKVVSSSEQFIKKNKGFNLPDTVVNENTLTDVDIEVIQNLRKLGISNAFDFLALSFVRKSSDVNMLDNIANQYIYYPDNVTGERRIPILIAKVETYQAVATDTNGEYEILDAIVRDFGGVMVARGDLAVEKSPEDVPLIQMYLTRRGIQQGKPVIIATQMLLSMCEKGHERPTRPEANDVATAVLNYADAMMLSEETAASENSRLCVATMRQIALKAEKSQRTERESLRYLGALSTIKETLLGTDLDKEEITKQRAIAESAVLFARNLESPVIVVSTSSGDTAMKISKYRPAQPIIAITDIEKSANKLMLYRGVYPVLVDQKPERFEDIIQSAKEIVQQSKINGKSLVEPRTGKKVCVPLTLGIEPGLPFSVATPGNTNTIHILEFC